MTVRELIFELTQLPPDLKIYHEDCEEGVLEVGRIRVLPCYDMHRGEKHYRHFGPKPTANPRYNETVEQVQDVVLLGGPK